MTSEGFKCKLLSWNDVFVLAKETAKKVEHSGYRPDFIVALARGGLVPARTLSDLLGVKDMAAIKVEHWGVTARPDKKAHIAHGITADLSGKKVLIVDDITDTGESMRVAIEAVQKLNPAEIRTVALQHINGSKHVPDYYAEEIHSWTWMIYPWNFVEDLTNLVGKALADGEPLTTEELKEKIMTQFEIDVSTDDLLMVLHHMDFRHNVDIVNVSGKVCWKNASVVVKTQA